MAPGRRAWASQPGASCADNSTYTNSPASWKHSTGESAEHRSEACRVMHILSASRVLPFHGMGGMQAIAWDVLVEFAKLGHQVTVLTTSIPDRASAWSEEGVRIVPLPHARSQKYTPQYWLGCREFVRSHTGDAFDA